ncbi:MAG: hypothetical protein NTW65_06720 [Deltaproteobacteria bacterium]|nr:hypothetical protein [Deltaproteobacteria bacterium]
MKNVGQVRFTPGKDGLSVSYQQIDMRSAVGIVEWDKIKIGERSDVLKKYKDNQDNTYEKAYNLDPGACYVEEIYYILNEGQLYIFDITLYAQDVDRLTYYHLVDTRLTANNS